MCLVAVDTTDTVNAHPVHQLAGVVLRPPRRDVTRRLRDVTSRHVVRGRAAVAVEGGDETVEEWRRNDGRKDRSTCHLPTRTPALSPPTPHWCQHE